jgi:hypothetical protein
MRWLAFIGSVLLALAVVPPGAWASDAKPAAGAKTEEVSADRKVVAPNVITPVVRDGKLVNYLFVTVEVELTDGANAMKLRDRTQFLRDSLLRATHRAALGDPANDKQLNYAAAKPVFSAAAVEALGASNIKKITIASVDSLNRR